MKYLNWWRFVCLFVHMTYTLTITEHNSMTILSFLMLMFVFTLLFRCWSTRDKLPASTVWLHRVYKTRTPPPPPYPNRQSSEFVDYNTNPGARPLTTYYFRFCFVEVELVALYCSPAVFSAAGWCYPDMTGALLHMFNNILYVYRSMHRVEITSFNRHSPSNGL